mgnify:CR=1 FL=1
MRNRPRSVRAADPTATAAPRASGVTVKASVLTKPQAPKPLDAEPISLTAKQDRRVPLADWLTSPKNEHFTKTVVNRVWANFFGVGLVEANQT